MEKLTEQELKENGVIEFTDVNENLIAIWFNEKTNNFSLQLNCKVIKATKTFAPIIKKLEGFGQLFEF